VLHSKNFVIQQQQHKIIVQILEQRKNGLELINQLYLRSTKINNIEVLSEEMRFQLVDYALSEGDYSEAASIMKSLSEPPPGKTLFDWRMRKARVLVLQGEYKNSENLILKTFTEKSNISHEELDRYMQVVFDFQTVQQHQQALKLFDLISLEGLDEKLKREINFWKAESFYSLEKYDRAALYYLESAQAVSDGINDLWAQSARFKAGQALVKAKIYDDAKKVLSDLLRITASDSRKAIINQKLQKIRLLKSAVRK
jgi:tetratricopeptide (TPR) repeat protein